MTKPSLPRRLINRAYDLGFVSLFDAHWRARLSGKVICLLYHRVEERGAHPFLDRYGPPTITPDELSADIRFYRERGARFLTFADLRRGEYPTDAEFGVMITFDDGLADSYGAALDVLESHGARGTIFQSTALIDGTMLIWEHELYWCFDQPAVREELRRQVLTQWPEWGAATDAALVALLRETAPQQQVEALLGRVREACRSGAEIARVAATLYPRAEQLRAAKARGHEIGSHGHRHCKRATISDGTFRTELEQSVSLLTTVCGVAPRAFSYPFNSYLPGDREQCGRYFDQAATVDAKLIDRDADALALPRFTWCGPQPNGLRRRRWLWTGQI